MPVYLDHAATTPMRPEAIAAYTEAMGVVGNPSSIHSQGQQARRMLEEARETIAATLGAEPIEVVFTSGGTEAINLAVKGMYWARNSGARRPRILVPGGEHHATLDTVEWLERAEGAEPSWLPLDAEGAIVVPDVIEGSDAALMTFLAVNNEVGTVQPVAALAEVARDAGVPVHVDAVAAYGHLPLDFARLGVEALSVSAHKIGGPVGIGALILNRTSTVVPLIHGGGQQRQVRSGTQDVAAAVSFAVAARAAEAEREAETARLTALRDRLIHGVRAAVPEAVLSGPEPEGARAARVASNVHFTFPGAQGDSLLFLLDLAGVSVSTGSACQAGIPEPSHVLLAMGRSETEARSALRFTLGRTSTEADVDALLAVIPGAYAQASRAGLAERSPRLGR
ncbi:MULTISPECIES: cysteine desulfurase family protein [unclassified Leifsonia]|uniref:cysteine desulfurase family protein n=1 Tax=unclassified Leifsonia TaxID=2663824 RepID=UPI0008A7E262|nr:MULTISPECIES: cysteine desulfurase family protein [unclassified Leifsonia]SEI09129.1 cysteine desulfurase [Leifsonia sp. CL154]SFL84260.1 cysteine desulfurase [Leifsonia sp. CL147]